MQDLVDVTKVQMKLPPEKYCKACTKIGSGHSLFNKCQKLLRKPHCCQSTKSFALGTSTTCELTSEERSFYESYRNADKAKDSELMFSVDELRFIDIEG